MGEEIIVKKTEKGKVIKAYCRICKQVTNHEIITDYNLHGKVSTYHNYLTGYIYYSWDKEFQIIRCKGCESVSFRKTESNSDDLCENYDNEIYYAVHIDIYPDPIEGRTPLNDLYFLPTNLRNIYIETLKSINSNQPILTGIGIRAIVESVCQDKNTSGNNLYDKINDLVHQGVLTTDGANILHKLRTMGNKAVHNIKPHRIDLLNLAMDVIDNLLLGVYILREKAKQEFV